MNALHLPSVADGDDPPYSFPDKPPPASALDYSTSFPEPKAPSSPKTHSYLISVTATALTRGELTWDETLFRHRFHAYGGAIPGHDVVGTIHTVYPSEASEGPPAFKPDDKVWGLLDFDRDGAACTYAIAHENELALAPSPPPNTTPSDWDSQLATIPLSGLTAYQALFDPSHGNIPPSLLATASSTTPHPRILILGPTGSVGLPALYLSLAASLATTVLTSSKHISFLRGLEASHTGHSSEGYPDPPLNLLVYDDESFSSLPEAFTSSSTAIEPVDLVIDTVGSTTLNDLLTSPDLDKVVKRGGKVITLVAPVSSFSEPTKSQVEENIKKHGVEVDFFIVKPNGEQLKVLGELASQGKLVGHVDAVYPLEKGREAMERVEGKSRGKGKVVVRVSD